MVLIPYIHTLNKALTNNQKKKKKKKQFFFKAPIARIYIFLPFQLWETLKEIGWSGGAMVLGKVPVPGRPTNLN